MNGEEILPMDSIYEGTVGGKGREAVSSPPPSLLTPQLASEPDAFTTDLLLV